VTTDPAFSHGPSDWGLTTLGEICRLGGGEIQTGPFGSQLHAADYVADGVPFIMPENLNDGRIEPEGIARITVQDADRLSRHKVRVGDIVYARRGVRATGERFALVRPPESGWICGSGCLRVRLGDGFVEPGFALFYLGHPAVKAWVKRHAIGATMPNLSTATLQPLPFLLPPLAEQRAIASILGALDDKIELNRRMNETLSSLAHALYRRTVDTAGKSNMHAVAIMEVARIAGGSTPSTGEPHFWEPGEHAWATPKDLAEQSTPALLRTARSVSQAGLDQISSGLLPAGTVLLSSRAPIGYLAISEIPVAINQGFIAMVASGPVSNHYVYHWALENMDAIKARSNGTTFLEVSKSNFRSLPITVPDPSVMAEFTTHAARLHARLVANEREIQTLTALRDTLLPKLISGKLRIKDAERLAESAL